MFSARVQWNLPINRLSLALQARKAAGAPILDLTESNPTRSGIVYDRSAVTSSLSQPGLMLYQPEPRGLPVARMAIAEYYRERGLVVDPDDLLLASGTSEAYGYLCKLLCDPGDELLIPAPGYPILEILTPLEGVRLAHYRLLYDEGRGWRIDLERLRNSVSRSTRAIVVVSPNNPTGSFLKVDELAEIGAICRQFDCALIVDEVFTNYGRGEDPRRVASAVGASSALTFVLNGLSKVVGLPQLKLSWIHVGGPEELRRNAMDRLELVSDAFLSVGAPVQHAAARILAMRKGIQEQIRRRLEHNNLALVSALSGGGCTVRESEGGWYAVVGMPESVPDEELVLRLLDEDGVLAHPGYFYDFPKGSFLVLSLLTPPEVFGEGVGRLAARMRREL
jgi:aspartate/methionine/tyrosine aminotransferase